MIDAPYAEYMLTQAPLGVEVTMPHGVDRLPLVPSFTLCVARELGWPIHIGGDRSIELGWGGSRNHTIDFDRELGWRVNHLGHAGTILHNNHVLHGMSRASPLADGDRVVPLQGLVFTFRHLPALPALAEELLRSSVLKLLQQAGKLLPVATQPYDVGYDWYDALISTQRTHAGQVLTDWVLERVADPEEAKHFALQLLARHGVRPQPPSR